MDNPKTRATLSIRHRTKTNKKKYETTFSLGHGVLLRPITDNKLVTALFVTSPLSTQN
jgi:hypothetical protein